MSIRLPLHNEYLKLISPVTDRARDVSDDERKNDDLMQECDLLEARSVIQLYLSGLALGARALLKGDLEKFDAVIGDHNCHVTATVAISAFKDDALRAEAEALLELVGTKQGKIHKVKANHPTEPHLLMQKFGLPTVSERMQYLIYAAILRSGTTCTENEDGSMTLGVYPNLLRQQLSKACPLALLEKLITPLRECVNLGSVAAVQAVGKNVLSHEEYMCLLDPKIGITPRAETFRFPCAFYNMKATLGSMMAGSVPFAVVKYDPKRKVGHLPLVFRPRLINPHQLDPQTPMFVIQAFFNDTLAPPEVGRAIDEYGLERFLLASIAVNSQFQDMKKAAFANDEDIRELPLGCHEEIASHRREGNRLRIDSEDPVICRVCHTYADTFKNLIKDCK